MATVTVYVIPSKARRFLDELDLRIARNTGIDRSYKHPYRHPEDLSDYIFKLVPRTRSEQGEQELIEHLNALSSSGVIQNFTVKHRKRKK